MNHGRRCYGNIKRLNRMRARAAKKKKKERDIENGNLTIQSKENKMGIFSKKKKFLIRMKD